MHGKRYKLTVLMAALALVSALSTPGIFMWGFENIGLQHYVGSRPALVGFVNVLRILFLLVPVAGFVAAAARKRWSLYCVIVFPALAWVFGAAAIPVVAFAFPSVMPRTIAITAINLCVMVFAAWLRWGPYNSSFKLTRERPRAA